MDEARDARTLRFYAEQAPVYVGSGGDCESRHLRGFLARLPAGARILELGCGGGRDSEAMIAAGFAVEPTDGTPAIAARAEARLGRPVRVMRFDELAEEAAYDAVWANAALLHVPRPALPGILARVFRALRPGGLHFASYKGGGAEGRDRHGRYFNYPSAEELRALYAQSAPWEMLDLVEYTAGGFVAVTLRRPVAAPRPSEQR